MPRCNVDLTQADMVSEGEKVATIQRVYYQVKVGEKWNKDGTKEVDADEWNSTPGEKRRLHFLLQVPGEGSIFHDLYFMDSALGMSKRALTAMGVAITKEGFDADEALNNHVGITVTHEQASGYDARAQVSKFYRF